MQDRNTSHEVDKLKQRLIAVWADMKQSIINKAIDEWCSQLATCVRAKGRHFEHLLCLTSALLLRLSNCVPKELY